LKFVFYGAVKMGIGCSIMNYGEVVGPRHITGI
jgi:hypothetical protein